MTNEEFDRFIKRQFSDETFDCIMEAVHLEDGDRYFWGTNYVPALSKANGISKCSIYKHPGCFRIRFEQQVPKRLTRIVDWHYPTEAEAYDALKELVLEGTEGMTEEKRENRLFKFFKNIWAKRKAG